MAGCVPTETVDPPGCASTYLELSGSFVADLVVTDNDTGDVVYDGGANVRIFQSAGRGTYWAGAIGTAKPEVVLVQAAWSVGGYDVTVDGYATATEGTFDDSVDNGEQRASFHYEFTNVRSPSSTATTRDVLPTVDFGKLPAWPLRF